MIFIVQLRLISTTYNLDFQIWKWLTAVKTSLTNHYRFSTNYVVDKTGLTIAYRDSTTFKIVKTRLANIYKTSIGFL